MAINPTHWKTRRVLVTGHSGFKGAWLCHWLMEMGAEVYGLSLGVEGHHKLHGLLDLSTRMAESFDDLGDSACPKRALDWAQPEVIFHLGAQALVFESFKDPISTFQSNIMGTAHLLEAVRQLGGAPDIIVVTTDKVYAPTPHAAVEAAALGGHDPYSASKAAAEIIVQSYQKSFYAQGDKLKAKVATARAGNVIGGGDFAPHRLIPDLARAWHRHQPVDLRNPQARRPWQYIFDALRGYLLLAQGLNSGDKKWQGPWNFGPKTAHWVSEVVGWFSEAWPQNAGFRVGQSPHPENPILRLDSQRAQDLMGWQPLLETQAAVLETAAWYHGYYAAGESPTRSHLNAPLESYLRLCG